MFIHDTVPPGVEVMKRLKDQITYTAQKTAKGAQLRIATRSPQALIAVHEFLRLCSDRALCGEAAERYGAFREATSVGNSQCEYSGVKS